VIAAAEPLGGSDKALIPLAGLGTLDTTIAVIYAELPGALFLDALRSPLLTVTLEVGETALAATAALDALRLTVSAPALHALELAFTASTFDALRLAFAAAAFHAEGALFAAAAAPLDAMRLMVATATALGLLASTAAATLSLGLSALFTALVGLR
jgi:hypothetical protein